MAAATFVAATATLAAGGCASSAPGGRRASPLRVIAARLCPDTAARSKGVISEGAWPRRPRSVVRASLTTAAFDSVLPFDRPFVVRVTSPDAEKVTAMSMTVVDTTCATNAIDRSNGVCDVKTQVRRRTALVPVGEFAFDVPPLVPNRPYLFTFTAASAAGEADARTIVGWPAADFRDHFDTDFGVIAAGKTGYVGLGSLVHFYFAPIRRGDDLRDVNSCGRRWLKRVNVGGGLSLVELNQRGALGQPVKHKFTFGTPVVGVGLRHVFWRPLRVTGGAIFFEQDAANPLVTRDRTKADLFASVTFDADLSALLGPLYAIVGLR